ncbi:hypothetical protein [Bradyrhizobium sp. RDI18]
MFGRTRDPWNISITSGGSTCGGAVSVASRPLRSRIELGWAGERSP